MSKNVITVDRMIKDLKKLSKKGYGEANILLSRDTEGNGYHVCYFPAQTIDKELLDWLSVCKEKYAEEIKNNPKSYIVLG
ncbi:hypothetical protein [Campylobacter concisus]|uniref:hypothetical protein n=1 Tax=Campylobacter concisus TaxID=199 RepID=UPI00122CCCD4|nr:hypothetical protein [Campylobacter concisus]